MARPEAGRRDRTARTRDAARAGDATTRDATRAGDRRTADGPALSSAEPPRTARDLRLARAGRRPPVGTSAENPLREGLRVERVPDPATLVLFGATGDLAHRKVVPALYQLWRTDLLPHELVIMAIGRRPYDEEAFRDELRASLGEHARMLPVDEDAWRELAARIVYHRGDFGDAATYDDLAARLDHLDADHGTRGNRLFYLATQPSAFPAIVAHLGRVGLDHERRGAGWRRIVVEKPFGRDLGSAIRLNREIGKVFREPQVYRIDHYLGKETVRNLLVFRFGNGIFEPIWNRRYIDHVQITVAESIGVESRGSYYEEAGASRDFLQNHLLQLLSLVAMEAPATFEADALRDEKVKVLRAIVEPTPEQVRGDIVRGQYGPGWVEGEQVRGYREEPEVHPASETETFLAARLCVDTWRWSGIPFYLRTGKRLPKRATEVAIQFKDVPHRLFRDSSVEPEPNLLAIRIQPDEGILLRIGAKMPGLGVDVRSVSMDFMYGSSFAVDSPDAYETLLLDALLGDASLFTRSDEVEEAWSIVDPIVDAWAEMPAPPFPNYAAGSWGPEAADELLGREGRRWRRI